MVYATCRPVIGQAWVHIDDELVANLSKEQKRTSSFFGNGGNGIIVPVLKIEFVNNSLIHYVLSLKPNCRSINYASYTTRENRLCSQARTANHYNSSA
jgi:hypothetical protein